MATLYKEFSIAAPPEFIWDAMKNIGAIHPIISIDDRRHRIAWAGEGGPLAHYNAVVELVAEVSGCRVVWTTDLLPDELEPAIAAMQDDAIAAMKCALEEGALAVNPYSSEAMYTPRLA